MAASTGTRRSSGPVLRSHSPSGKFYGGATASSSASAFASSTFASSTSSSFSHRFVHRSASPTRVNLFSSAGGLSSAAVKFAGGRPISAQTVHRKPEQPQPQKRTCMCSPTNHPGSFRCSLHKNSSASPRRSTAASGGPYQSNRLFARRSAMTNSLVRIGTVEGDLVKRALAALIRPSSHHQRRRADFQPRPSRLSVMSTTESH